MHNLQYLPSSISEKIITLRTIVRSLFVSSIIYSFPSNAVADTLTVGLSDGSDFQTIQEAVSAAAEGDTVYVNAGIYNEAITLTRAITLQGANAGIDPNTDSRGEESVITGSGSIRIIASAQNIVIDGFEITNTEGALSYEHGAILIPPRNDGSTVGGADFNQVGNITIRNNWFHDLNARPVLKDCFAAFTNLTIANNRIEAVGNDENTRSGIKLQSRCQAGTQSSGLVIRANVIRNTTYAGIIVDSIDGITISDNTISNTPEHGINLGASYGNNNVLISDNHVSEAALPNGSAALRIKGGTYSGTIAVERNSFTDSRIGLKIESGVTASSNFVVQKNIFTGNTTVASLVNESSFTLEASRNWWGDATGPSGEGEGSGDAIGSKIDFSEWCLAEDCLTYKPVPPVTVCSEDCDFTIIQDAIDSADAGSTIRVGDGIYNRVVIDKPLTLLSENGADSTVINGAGVGQGWGIRISSDVDNVTIGAVGHGFTVNGVSNDLAALYLVQDNDTINIIGNTLNGGTGSALITGGLITSTTFEANTFNGNGPRAIAYVNGATSLGAARASDDVSFVDNQFNGSVNAGLILGIEASNSTVSDNTFSGLYSYASLELWAAGTSVSDNSFLAVGDIVIIDAASNYSIATLLGGNGFSKAVSISGVSKLFTSIQSAINAAAAGDIVTVSKGTYAEALQIDKSLTLVGAGDSDVEGTVISIPGADTGITVTSSAVTLKDLRIVKGDATDMDDGKGLEIIGSEISDLELNGVTITGATNGLRIGSGTSVDGFIVIDSHFDNNDIGWYIAKESSSSSSAVVVNVEVSDSSFNNNLRKGLYTEKLGQAMFDNIEVHNSGIAAGYLFNNGIDINLKWSDYSDISITNSSFLNAGRFVQLHNDEDFSGALVIKARDDGAYASPAASLSGVTLSGNKFTSNSDNYRNALRLGEPAADNSSPINVTLTSNTFSGFSKAFTNASLNELENSLAIYSQPEDAVNGLAIPGSPGIRVVNIVGEPVSGAAVTVSVVEGASLSSGAVTVISDNSGLALFDDLVINAVGSFRLHFSVSGTSLEITSASFEVIVDSTEDPIIAPSPTEETDDLVENIVISDDDEEVSEEVIEAINTAAESAANLAEEVINTIDEVNEDTAIDALETLSNVAEVSGKAAAKSNTSGNSGGADSAGASGLSTIDGFSRILSALDNKVSASAVAPELSVTQKAAVQAATVKAVASATQVLAAPGLGSAKNTMLKNLGAIISSSANLGVTITDSESEALFAAAEQQDESADLESQLDASIPIRPKNKALVSKTTLASAFEGAGVSDEELDEFLIELANSINPADVNIGSINGQQSLGTGFSEALDNSEGTVEFDPDTGIIFFSFAAATQPALQRQGNIDFVALSEVPKRIPARVVSANIVSSNFPDGISVKADGAVVITNSRIASITVPASYDPINLYADTRKLGFDVNVSTDGNLVIRGGGATFSATFDFVGATATGESQPSTSFTVPTAKDESDPAFIYGVSYRDGTRQALQPFVLEDNFIASIKAAGITVSTDRNSGIITGDGFQFRPSYFVEEPDEAATDYWVENQDDLGIAYRPIDGNGDGLLDFQVITATTVQLVYGVIGQQ